MLTLKQEAFVQGLISGKSQREAYRAAYPKSANWKDKTVDEAGSRLFKNSKVSARHDEIMGKIIAEAEAECLVDGKRVIKELVSIAFADVTEFAEIKTVPRRKRIWDSVNEEYLIEESTDHFEQIVTVKDTSELPKHKTAAIKSIKQGRYGIEIELYPKDKSLELLGKHLKIFTESVEVLNKTENPYEGLTTEELKKLAGIL